MWVWILRPYARFALRRPWACLLIAGLLSAGSVAVLPLLKVKTSRTALAGESDEVQRRILAFFREFGYPYQIIASVEAATAPEASRAFADQLAAALSREKDEVRAVFHRVDIDSLKDKGWLYIPLDDLKRFAQIVSSPQLPIAEFLRIRSLEDLFSSLDKRLAESLARPPARPPSDLEIAGGVTVLRILGSLFEEMKAFLVQPDKSRIEVLEKLYFKRFAANRSSFDVRGTLSSRDGKVIYLFIRPVREDDSAEEMSPFVARVRQVVARERARFSTAVDVGLTGMPVWISDEMETIASDTTLITIASLIGIALLYALAFRFSFRIVFALLPIVAGTLWTYGFTTVVVGHLSLLTSALSAILFGIGDDFGLHLLSRFDEETSAGHEAPRAVERAIIETGPGVLTGALAAAAAFYATILVPVPAFRELGLVAGTGLLFVAVAALLLLPPLFLFWDRVRRRRGWNPASRPASVLFSRVLGERLPRYPWVVVAVAVVFTTFLVWQTREVPFNYDLMQMLPARAESVRYQARLIERSDFSPEFAAVLVRSLAEVREKSERVSALPSVARVDSIAPFIPPERIASPGSADDIQAAPATRGDALGALLPPRQEEKIAIARTLAPLFKGLPERFQDPPPVDTTRLTSLVDRLAERFERVVESAPRALAQAAGTVAATLLAVRDRLASAAKDGASGPAVVARAQAFQRELFAGLNRDLQTFRASIERPEPVTTGGLARATGGLLDNLVGKSGRYAIYAFPRGPIWDRALLSTFVAELRGIDAHVTGFPVSYYHFSERIRAGFVWAALCSAGIILVLLFVELRSIRNALLAAIPLAFGAAWMLGIMNLIGLEYNFANIVALPLLIGLGVEYGVEMIHRFQEDPRIDFARLLSTTGRATALAALTTVLGLGSMILASHRGVASLGLLLVCGIAGCLLASLVILPAVLQILRR